MSTSPASSAPQPAPAPSQRKEQKPPFQLTPEQLAKQAERKALKALKVKADGEKPLRSKEQLAKGEFKRREWITVNESGEVGEGTKVKVMSWNMLAQTLVRRDLFPGSDCLKFATREQMLISELTAYDADIICLQEVDQLSALSPHLTTYSVTTGSGRKKRHGLVILHRTTVFDLAGKELVYLDEAEVREGGGDGEQEARRRRAGTRETKNIGLMVALKDKNGKGGVIVATCHLFWHPLYLAERTRQVAVLWRETLKFRKAGGWEDWSIIMAGDFNTQPFEPSYSLLVNPSEPLTDTQRANLENSSVVHKSVTNVKSTTPVPEAGMPEFVPPNSTPAPLQQADDDEGGDEGEGGEKGEDQGIMKNARLPVEEDGLLSVDELTEIFKKAERQAGGTPKSLYDEAGRILKGKALKGLTLGERLTEEEQWLKVGRGEPCYTSFTPYWHLTLDYIFLLPPSTTLQYPHITAFLQPHSPETLGTGLPRTKISASDHVVVAGEIVLPA